MLLIASLQIVLMTFRKMSGKFSDNGSVDSNSLLVFQVPGALISKDLPRECFEYTFFL